MQAMDPAAADLYEEDGKDLDFYDFEPLPTLPEDEENVSLADILSLRDRGLSEQEAWAVCLECSLSMRSVAHAAIFQSLCITPDTLAFNTSGNVCFMEQLSDDPEGAFVPPEFDVTGNTFEVSAGGGNVPHPPFTSMVASAINSEMHLPWGDLCKWPLAGSGAAAARFTGL
ncbi:kinase non-catalytic C-lobe domain-containing protein 1 isoform 2 [Homo sapiens]|uniref:Kinase non-catalytic C-lobe domain containing 1 n=1 Tax=Homo sapiens TaxID=9606 RepID=A0A804HIZ4_HUMAN|nr:kinase non-catalytic C-lobe domain-containing protein 1 isoform 2 [Homo sapiens]|eukprot:NP_001334793.1 kinase non-catalytic C-lobe domain-containing protein 1 isoform 2 [Homo sapiens]